VIDAVGADVVADRRGDSQHAGRLRVDDGVPVPRLLEIGEIGPIDRPEAGRERSGLVVKQLQGAILGDDDIELLRRDSPMRVGWRQLRAGRLLPGGEAGSEQPAEHPHEGERTSVET
jgi:hypothetical protein